MMTCIDRKLMPFIYTQGPAMQADLVLQLVPCIVAQYVAGLQTVAPRTAVRYTADPFGRRRSVVHSNSHPLLGLL